MTDELIDAIADLDFTASAESWDATVQRFYDALNRVRVVTAASGLDFTD